MCSGVSGPSTSEPKSKLQNQELSGERKEPNPGPQVENLAKNERKGPFCVPDSGGRGGGACPMAQRCSELWAF